MQQRRFATTEMRMAVPANNIREFLVLDDFFTKIYLKCEETYVNFLSSFCTTIVRCACSVQLLSLRV